MQNAADDEPIFVLRAQDNLAAATVRYWAMTFRQAIAPPGGSVENNVRYNKQIAKYHEAMALAEKMDGWKNQKTPD